MTDMKQVKKLAVVKALSLNGGGDLVFIKEASTGNSTVNSTLNSTGNIFKNTNLVDKTSDANFLSNIFKTSKPSNSVSDAFNNSKPRGHITMAELISPYYKNMQGGLDGVIERANNYRQSLKGTPEENFPFLSTNKDHWDEKMDVRNYGGPDSLLYAGYTIRPSKNPFIKLFRKGFNPQTMFISENLNLVDRRISQEHEGSHLLQYRDPNYSDDKMDLNGKPSSKRESYYGSPGEKAPRLAHIKRIYAQQTGNEVTDPEIARDAYDWYRKWVENKNERLRRSIAVITGLDPSNINLNSVSEQYLEYLMDDFNSRIEQARKDLESSDIFNRESRARRLDELIKKQRELLNIRKQFPDPEFNLHGDEDAWIDLYDNPESMRVMPGLVWNNPLRGISYFS